MARRRVHEGFDLEMNADYTDDDVNNKKDAVEGAANAQYEMKEMKNERYRIDEENNACM